MRAETGTLDVSVSCHLSPCNPRASEAHTNEIQLLVEPSRRNYSRSQHHATHFIMLLAARRLVFSILFNAIVLAKIVHLYVNAHSFSLAAFLVCLPVFLIPDVLVLLLVWSLLQNRRGRCSLLSTVASCLVRYGWPFLLKT